MIVMWNDWAESHSWKEITGAGTFEHHNPDGKTLYGAEVFVDPDLQGQGVGHLLYEARRTLCRAMNLKRIIACGRLPGYHRYADEFSAEFYAQKVVWGDPARPGTELPDQGRLQLLRRHRGLHPRRRGVARLRLDHRVAQSDLQPQPPHPSSPRRFP